MAMKSDQNDEQGGERVNPNNIVAQYQTTRIRQLWTSYKRIFQVAVDSIVTLDPSTFAVTNSFNYSRVNKLGPDDKPDQFTFEVDKVTYVFKTAHRAQLLCQLFECIYKNIPQKFKIFGPYSVQRLRKNGYQIECKLQASPYGIVECLVNGTIVQEYKFINISEIGIDETTNGFFLRCNGRIKIFIVPDLQSLVKGCKSLLKQLGIDSVSFLFNQNLSEMVATRVANYTSTGAPVSIFDVNKSTKRSLRLVSRQMQFAEEFIVEKDPSGFQFVSFQPISTIYALVRSWTNPREFTIEYDNGTSRTYTCAVRDTLLAMLLDIAHAIGNIRVIVTGEVSDGLRLMPRFAEEEYQASISDHFFGASSIEAWFLSRLSKACRPANNTNNFVDETAVELACRELNANVPCPGIAPTSDQTQVKACLRGVLTALQSALISAAKDSRLDNSRSMVLLLQTLFRLIPSTAGYRGFVEVKEVDTRLLLMQLIQFDSDFVNYWALLVLTALCKCPLTPRNMQQEFVNKHTLLADQLLICLIELMSSRIDVPLDETEELVSDSTDHSVNSPVNSIEQGQTKISVVPSTDSNELFQKTQTLSDPTRPSSSVDATGAKQTLTTQLSQRNLKIVKPNPSAFSHLPTTQEPNMSDLRRLSVAAKRRQTIVSETVEDTFFPNSLVVIAAAGLLESIVSGQRDTSSPELLHKVFDVMSEHCEVLVHMLRSNSLLITETAAILMFVLLKNRPRIGDRLREMALSECLVVKSFHSAVFSPSGSQRFISRFLIATWMSGHEKTNAAKGLLLRMVPPGLIEYLKHAPINEEQRKNLDELEEDFYAEFGGSSKNKTVKAVSDLQLRMRRRITAVLKDQAQAIDKLSPRASTGQMSSTKNHTSDTDDDQILTVRTQVHIPAPDVSQQVHTPPENYRIMFHMITQDHKLPDLIWNEQTRLELRSCLEQEIRDFEIEQRLKGYGRVAWNYQQFSVRYESLRDEMQIGSVYVRHFLDAGDSYLRSLESPSHVVLFEKMFRRILVSADSNPGLSILCARCLTRLYSACHDIIGEFDDMMLIIKMLARCDNLELQHCLIDLINSLTSEPSNALQLLDREFVEVIIKYASLAHLNPDGIGNLLAQATAQVLMLTNDAGRTTANMSTSGDRTTSEVLGISLSADETTRMQMRSSWVPADGACPKTWFVAPPGIIPPPQNKQRGPFRVSDLVKLFDDGQLDESCLVAPCAMDGFDEDQFEAMVDTGKWRSFKEYFQLRIQMLLPGKVVYSPAEVSRKAVSMLSGIAAVHQAVDARGVTFFPIPHSKRIMSESDHLIIFAQLLLSNDSELVDVSSRLLLSLVEHNGQACSKLYLTGVFFFACRYSGNNFLTIARLLDSTHLKQSFHDAATSVANEQPIHIRSVLGSLLPAAMVNLLANYGAERFAVTFTGDSDTPEVIWNASLRHFLVEMIDQHLGDFPLRLKQYTLARYEYCPIAKVHYRSLEKELYVHEYYLRNLCDEHRFPDYCIAEPLQLLRDVLERWREELAKGVVDSSVAAARNLLGLSERFDNKELRKAYKNMAKQYHPDKNPEGRDMFEQIHKAYELLSMQELNANDTDMENVWLLIHTQNIIYRRYHQEVSDQKYPAFLLLVQVLRVPPLDSPVNGFDLKVLSAGVTLINYTCSISPLNSREFVKLGAVERLLELLDYAMKAYSITETCELAHTILVNGWKACTSIAQFEGGRNTLLSHGTRFTDLLRPALVFTKTVPIAVENAVETISRCCSLQGLQQIIVDSGAIWKLIPMLLAYDGTLQEDFTDESQRTVYNQSSSNMIAVLAAKCLGRLGGYMFDELASPVNEQVRLGLSRLLTVPLAKYLRNRRPWELLGALNENIEKTTKIWNVGMRRELLQFVSKVDSERPPGTRDNDLAPANEFVFSCIRDELCVGGVYVRIFNKTGDTTDIDDPSQYCRELLEYIRCHPEMPDSSSRRGVEHLEQAVEGLRVLAQSHTYIAGDIAVATHGLTTVFELLSRPPESASFVSAANLIGTLCESSDFVTGTVRCEPPVVWRLLTALCTNGSPSINKVWEAAEDFCSHPDGLSSLVESSAVPHLLGVVFGTPGYVNVFNSRFAAVSLLSKFLWNPIRGPDASAMLRRFLPEPVVLQLKNKAGRATLQLLDDVCENPELIWTAEMQGELRQALTTLLASRPLSESFKLGVPLRPDYAVHYRQLSEEIHVGGVYKLVEFWEASFTTQVPKLTDPPVTVGDSRALVLGKEDFLTLLTSCIVCILKGEASVMDHLLSWEFMTTLSDCLKRALDGGKRGTPVVSIIRLLHQAVGRLDAVDSLASARSDIILQLTRSLNENINDPSAAPALPKEATLITELLKKIFQSVASDHIGYFVRCGVKANLPNYLLDHVIAVAPEAVKEVRNPSALRIHAVDVLKAMIAADEESASFLQSLVDLHPAWNEYRDQSHDLFITNQERQDPFLLLDASGDRFRGLLTNGATEEGNSPRPFTSSTTTHSTTMPVYGSMPPTTSRADSTVFVASSSGAPPSVSPSAHKSSLKAIPPPNIATSPSSSNGSYTTGSQDQPRAPSPLRARIETTVVKGDHGLGLDVAKDAAGAACIIKFKAMPEGVPNPSLSCIPVLLVGDVIVEVNGSPCDSFTVAVSALRALPAGSIKLAVVRKL